MEGILVFEIQCEDATRIEQLKHCIKNCYDMKTPPQPEKPYQLPLNVSFNTVNTTKLNVSASLNKNPRKRASENDQKKIKYGY
jgi:hypothetical protein